MQGTLFGGPFDKQILNDIKPGVNVLYYYQGQDKLFYDPTYENHGAYFLATTDQNGNPLYVWTSQY